MTINDRLRALDEEERHQIAEAELFDDFAHSSGRIAAIRAAFDAKRAALREKA